MIVISLKATAIPRGPMILTECGMLKLFEGDILHCLPALAHQLIAKYPDHLKVEKHDSTDYHDYPDWVKDARYHLVALPRGEAKAKATELVHTAPDLSPQGIIATNGNPGDAKLASEKHATSRRAKTKPAAKEAAN